MIFSLCPGWPWRGKSNRMSATDQSLTARPKEAPGLQYAHHVWGVYPEYDSVSAAPN